MKLLNQLIVAAAYSYAQEGSGQNQDEEPSTKTPVDLEAPSSKQPELQKSDESTFPDENASNFDYANYYDSFYGNYLNSNYESSFYEEADLGFVQARSSSTQCRVGSFSTRSSAQGAAVLSCPDDQVCQTTLEYQRIRGGAAKRYYRIQCKEEQACLSNMKANFNRCRAYSWRHSAQCVNCCSGSNCASDIPYEGAGLEFTDFPANAEITN